MQFSVMSCALRHSISTLNNTQLTYACYGDNCNYCSTLIQLHRYNCTIVLVVRLHLSSSLRHIGVVLHTNRNTDVENMHKFETRNLEWSAVLCSTAITTATRSSRSNIKTVLNYYFEI